jgi:hypothetical protein
LKLEKNKHASKTPGPILLSSFPIVSSLNPLTQTIADLIYNFHIASVITIEEKFIAEQIWENEIKALPSDWLLHGVAVGLVQCPDLHALRLFHDFLVAQYSFSEVLTLLPPVNDSNYLDTINDLMKKHFQESDKNTKIKEKSTLLNLFHKATDEFSSKPDDENYIHFLQEMVTKLKWKTQSESPQTINNQEHVLIHCKAGMSRSATALLSMYIIFIDVILRWHPHDFIQNEKDEAFFGAILKAIVSPGHDPLNDVHNIIRFFSDNYRPIKLIPDQVMTLAQLIQYKHNMLKEAHVLDNIVLSEEPAHQTFSRLTHRSVG